jgi:PTH1 family peptidyl-tRNA hydrolase
MAVEKAANDCKAGEWTDKQKFMSVIAEGEIAGAPCFFVKPTTYMNRSGEAIRKLSDFYKLNPATDILVCCDDVDIPLGTHRLRMTGGPGTHNGLKSIVDTFGENFPRFRIGLGPQPANIDLANWVLSILGKEEMNALQKVFNAVVPSVQEIRKAKS